MGIHVRRARKRDIEEYAKLQHAFYSELREKQGWKVGPQESFMKEAEEQLERDVIFVAEHKGELVGFLRLSRREGCFWAEELFVKREFRGRGIGKMLVSRAEEYARERDNTMYLIVLPQNQSALSFWVHMGYDTLNSIELVKHLDGNRTDVDILPVLGRPLRILRWKEGEYDDLQRGFLDAVRKFFEEGFTPKDYLSTITEALKRKIESSRSPREIE